MNIHQVSEVKLFCLLKVWYDILQGQWSEGTGLCPLDLIKVYITVINKPRKWITMTDSDVKKSHIKKKTLFLFY